MSARSKILGISVGLGSVVASGSFLNLFSQDNTNTKTNDISEGDKKRKVAIDGYDLKQVQIFVRHGARTPIHLMRNVEEVTYDKDMFLSTVPHTTYNYNVMTMEGGPRPSSKYDDHYKDKLLKGGATPGSLTCLGQDQMYVAGQRLAHQYIDETGLLDSAFSPDQIKVRSTNINRTIATARCILAGMYTHQQLNNLPEVPTIYVAHAREDELLPRTFICPVLRQINHSAMIHGGNIPELKGDKLQLEAALGIQDHPDNKTNFIFERDDIVARETHGHSIPEVVRPLQNMIEHNATLVMFYAFCGQHQAERDVAIQLSSGPLIKMVLDNIDNIEQSTTKFYLNSCHDSTLVGMQGLLDIFDGKWPPFGSDIRFELYEQKDTKEKYVRVSYNDKDKIVRGCSSELCPLEEFRTAMKPYSIDKKTYNKICSSDILNVIAKEMMQQEEGEVEDEESKTRSNIPAGM